MTTQSSVFTAVGLGPIFSVKPGQSIQASSSGTFTGFLSLLRSRNQGATFEVVQAAAEDANIVTTSYLNETKQDERWRFQITGTVTGTATGVIADVNDVVRELKDNDGRVYARVTDDGVEFLGNASVAGTLAVTGASSTPLTTDDIGAKNGATVSVVEYGDAVWHKTVITCTATPVAITDDAGVAQYGGAGKLYDFPEGLLCVLGAVVDGAVTLGTTGTITNTWAGGVALGTATATTGATLTGTEADIMPEVDVAAATAKVAVVDSVSVATALTESGARWLDGTATAKDLFLNLVVDDEATHTTGTGTFTGTITIIWTKIGDK